MSQLQSLRNYYEYSKTGKTKGQNSAKCFCWAILQKLKKSSMWQLAINCSDVWRYGNGGITYIFYIILLYMEVQLLADRDRTFHGGQSGHVAGHRLVVVTNFGTWHWQIDQCSYH